jgi:hypothetical protein
MLTQLTNSPGYIGVRLGIVVHESAVQGTFKLLIVCQRQRTRHMRLHRAPRYQSPATRCHVGRRTSVGCKYCLLSYQCTVH